MDLAWDTKKLPYFIDRAGLSLHEVNDAMAGRAKKSELISSRRLGATPKRASMVNINSTGKAGAVCRCQIHATGIATECTSGRALLQEDAAIVTTSLQTDVLAEYSAPLLIEIHACLSQYQSI